MLTSFGVLGLIIAAL